MTEPHSDIEPAAKQLERIIIDRYQAALPKSVENFKGHDLDQLRQAAAENEAMRNAVTVGLFALANRFDKLVEEIRSISDSINRISKAVEEMPDLIRNTMLAAVAKPAGKGRVN